MAHLIDKDALVEKIWQRRMEHFNFGGSPASEYCHEDDEIFSIINTIEVKEVDLEKELDSMITPELKFHKAFPSLFDVAKHFFELGLKVTNSLTWQDIFIIRRLIYEYDKEIKMKSDIKYPLREEFCTEVLKRFKYFKETGII